MARGQAEILGIAVVIVLVIMGLLFLLRFSTPGDAGQLKERIGRAQIANNMLSAMFKTNDIYCDPSKKPKLDELIIDCTENHEAGGSVVCQEKLSCQYVKDILEKQLFPQTIEKWKLGYEFTVEQAGKNIISLMKTSTGKISKCSAASEVDSQTYPLPTTIGIMKVTLKICT